MTGPRRAVARGARAAGGAALACAVISAAACAPTGGPPTIPDTPAGGAFRAWLGAYNAADSARLEAYARRYEPVMSVHTQLTFRAQTGPWDVASVERSDPRHLEVTLRTHADSSTRYTAPLTMYAVVDVADGVADGTSPDSTTPRATTRLTLLGTGPRAPVPRIGAAERAAAVDSIVAKVVRDYVIPDVARRIADSLRARKARGAYDGDVTEVSFAERLTRDLRALGGDPQLDVEYVGHLRWPLPPPEPAPPAWVHCGLGPARVMADGLGYVTLYGFRWPELDCSHRVAEAMQAVAGARALVLDLRDAGDELRPQMAFIASYLVAGCTHVGDLWDRRTGATEALWTHDGLPGPAFGSTKPLVLLTSARTFAAAEELAYALQHLGRATVVGERTGGAAHTSVVGPVGAHLIAQVPVARVSNPTTGTNWQGVGVQLDVPVPAGEALATAERLIREGRIPEGLTPPAPRVASASSHPRPPGRAAADPGGTAAVTRGGTGPAGLPEPMGGALRGVRFGVDTLVPYAPWRGVLSRVAGVVEFAGGRGRFDVQAVSHAAAVALDGITVGEPLARPGDYYLFDNTGFVLVRPAARTFSRVAFTRADFTGGALLPGAYMMKDLDRGAPVSTGSGADGARPSHAPVSHAPVTVHWHMQPPNYGPTHDAPLYARGWLDVEDAPAVEAGVARWFEVAAALATRPGRARALPPDGVEVTSVVVLRRPDGRGRTPANGFLEMLTPRHLTAADVDPARLVLPSGYTETRWPGFAGGRGLQAPSWATAARWRTLEDETSQRARAACAQAWLPEPSEERAAAR